MWCPQLLIELNCRNSSCSYLSNNSSAFCARHDKYLEVSQQLSWGVYSLTDVQRESRQNNQRCRVTAVRKQVRETDCFGDWSRSITTDKSQWCVLHIHFQYCISEINVEYNRLIWSFPFSCYFFRVKCMCCTCWEKNYHLKMSVFSWFFFALDIRGLRGKVFKQHSYHATH